MSVALGAQSLDRRVGDLPPLPAWPVVAAFGGYLLWWVLGVGDVVWIAAGAAALATWAGRHDIRVPVAMAAWGLFLVWVTGSLVMTDTPGRLGGAVYRLLLYGSAGILLVHVVNARRTLPLRAVTGTATAFLGAATIGGLLALAAPTLTFRTPMALAMPGSLLANDLVHDMVVRSTSQWVSTSWADLSVRPSAPFLYTNTWGNVYSLVLPLALLHLWLVWDTRWRLPVLALVVVSVVPAAATSNRGMYLGLLVVALWVALQAVRRGRHRLAGLGLAGILVGGLVWWLSPLGQELARRVTTTNSTQDRASLYLATWQGAVASPLLGWGAPRPAEAPWLPSLGTQGQLWTTLFSHGIPGLVFFLGFLLLLLFVAARRTDAVGAVLGGVIAATLVETAYYGMSTGLMVTMLAGGLLLRGDTVTGISTPDRPRSATRAAATPRHRTGT